MPLLICSFELLLQTTFHYDVDVSFSAVSMLIYSLIFPTFTSANPNNFILHNFSDLHLWDYRIQSWEKFNNLGFSKNSKKKFGNTESILDY